jgi:DNA-binding NtrC family response regulator
MTDVLKILFVMRAEHRNAVIPFLAREGCEVRLAADCREARHLLRREHFDVVFTDASLPDGNWLTISRASNHEDAPPALVVYLPRQAERLAAILGAGPVKVLMPPLEAETIQGVLEVALRGRQTLLQPFTAAPHYAPPSV